jgi:DUF1365 family protein
VDLDHLDSLKSKLFSINRFNLFSFNLKDYGPKDGTNLKSWATNTLSRAGVLNFKGRVTLQTMPRVLGYVFNPVNFWFCHEDEKLRAVILEVNNTFSETHCYVLKGDVGKTKQKLPKIFHVSPFYEVEGHYEFDFTTENQVSIDLINNEQKGFFSSISGEGIPWTDKNLLRIFFRHPMFTMAVVFLIHWQALKLFIKKVPYFSKPNPPNEEVSYEY